MSTNHVTKTHACLAARCAAVASIGAAVIHCAVTPMHWSDWRPSGVFFAAIAVFQFVWGFVAWSWPTRLLLAVGILGNFASAGLWVLSRTAGAPFGPNAGEAEAVEAAGIAVLLLQCYVIMGAAWALLRRHRGDEISGFGRALVLLGANTVMAVAVTVGLASSLQGHHHHGPVEIADRAAEPGAHPHGHPQPAEPGRPMTEMVLKDPGAGQHHLEPVVPVAPPEADDHHHDHG